MATLPIDAPFVTVEGYLHTLYEPDCDYVDGRIEDRLVGWYGHASTIASLLWILSGKEEWQSWPLLPLSSLRTRVALTRIRCPDVCVLRRGGTKERILSSPPLAVFEVLEPEDRLNTMMEKLADFDRFGVAHIWLIDPDRRLAYRYVSGGLHPIESGELTVPETPIRVVLSELFAELDRA
jgi:Uma2 family endonuclease